MPDRDSKTRFAAERWSPPRVTVATTTYNGAEFLRETIESVLAQTYPDFEYLIIDDCSTDGTIEIIQSYSDPRIHLVLNEQNQGISNSRNLALDLARGEFFAATDQDDVSLPLRLERQVQFLDSNPNVAMVSSAVDLLSSRGRRRDPMRALQNPALLHFALFFGRHNVTYSSIMARMQILRAHGLRFRPEFHYAEDYELYHRLAKVGGISTLPEPLVLYRIHATNSSLTQHDEMSANGRRFLSRAYDDLLGRALSNHEIDAIWQLAVEQKSAESIAQLRQVGGLIEETLRAFQANWTDSLDDHEALGCLASDIWWSILRASLATVGPRGLSVSRDFPTLAANSPSILEMSRLMTASMLPGSARAALSKVLRRG